MSLTLTLERGGGEVSGSGTNIELDGTIAGGSIESVEMYGDTQQQTYSGKNLFSSAIEQGGFDSNGAKTASSAYRTATPIPINPNTQYSLTSSGASAYDLYYYDSSMTYLGYGYTTGRFTTRNDAVFLNISTSGSVGAAPTEWQLELGSTPTSFEPYVGGTASPNPDYPQEVQTVTGRQVVTISDGGNESQEYEINLGKNLFDKNAISSGYLVGRTDGILAANSSYGASDFIRVQEGETYTFTGFNYWYSAYYDGNKQYVGYPTNTATITVPAGVSYIRTSLLLTTLDTAQFEKGSTATTYAPYFTPIELCKIGTYQDYIYKSGNDWYIHKEIKNLDMSTITDWQWRGVAGDFYRTRMNTTYGVQKGIKLYSNIFTYSTTSWSIVGFGINASNDMWMHTGDSALTSQNDVPQWLANRGAIMYGVMVTPTDYQITNADLITQLNALNEATTYDGTTVITVSSENLAGSLEVTASSSIAKTYTEVEIGSPFTITDVEGKSSNTTLDGNVYVDWAYNKKQYSFDLFNLTPQDYADIRAFYDYQFNNSAFPTITVPELNIDKLPVYMEISSRNIINQCLLTDKLTIKFRETVQP